MNIKTNGKQIVALNVPVEYTEFYNSLGGFLCGKPHYEAIKIDGHRVYMEEFDEIIGLLSDLTEKQAAEYVEGTKRHYASYLKGGKISTKMDCDFAIGSLYSLLKAHGLDTTSPILIIEKV